jgi:hypothetical protein
MCISRDLRVVEAGWEASVRLLARHFLQFASSEVKKSISRLSMWLVVAASRGLRDIPHHPQSAIRRDNSHLSRCWTNQLLAKSAWLFQGQIILLPSYCCVKRHVEIQYSA